MLTVRYGSGGCCCDYLTLRCATAVGGEIITDRHPTASLFVVFHHRDSFHDLYVSTLWPHIYNNKARQSYTVYSFSRLKLSRLVQMSGYGGPIPHFTSFVAAQVLKPGYDAEGEEDDEPALHPLEQWLGSAPAPSTGPVLDGGGGINSFGWPSRELNTLPVLSPTSAMEVRSALTGRAMISPSRTGPTSLVRQLTRQYRHHFATNDTFASRYLTYSGRIDFSRAWAAANHIMAQSLPLDWATPLHSDTLWAGNRFIAYNQAVHHNFDRLVALLRQDILVQLRVKLEQLPLEAATARAERCQLGRVLLSLDGFLHGDHDAAAADWVVQVIAPVLAELPSSNGVLTGRINGIWLRHLSQVAAQQGVGIPLLAEPTVRLSAAVLDDDVAAFAAAVAQLGHPDSPPLYHRGTVLRDGEAVVTAYLPAFLAADAVRLMTHYQGRNRLVHHPDGAHLIPLLVGQPRLRAAEQARIQASGQGYLFHRYNAEALDYVPLSAPALLPFTDPTLSLAATLQRGAPLGPRAAAVLYYYCHSPDSVPAPALRALFGAEAPNYSLPMLMPYERSGEPSYRPFLAGLFAHPLNLQYAAVYNAYYYIFLAGAYYLNEPPGVRTTSTLTKEAIPPVLPVVPFSAYHYPGTYTVLYIPGVRWEEDDADPDDEESDDEAETSLPAEDEEYGAFTLEFYSVDYGRLFVCANLARTPGSKRSFIPIEPNVYYLPPRATAKLVQMTESRVYTIYDYDVEDGVWLVNQLRRCGRL